jgi:predicted amino acid racemase
MQSSLVLPTLTLNLDRVRSNSRIMCQRCRQSGIEPVGVTKLVRGEPQVAHAMLDGGIRLLADSRLENLKRLTSLGVPRMLLRLPGIHQASEVVRHSEISLNSEAGVLRALSMAALEQQRLHKVILMQDLGDLREGCFDEAETLRLAHLVHSLPGLELEGIGANLACYGGVAPSVSNQKRLVRIAEQIRSELHIPLRTVSGSTSAAAFMLEDGTLPEGITQLRLGASLLMGIGLNDDPIPGLALDSMKLTVEIIELKQKPSVPENSTALNAQGKKPEFADLGIRWRALCALGQQDVDFNHLTPHDPGVRIVGASSDHLILDVTGSEAGYQVGDSISFTLSYGGALQCMTSDYIHKEYI